MSSERRQHYRVSPNAVREVRVSVRDADGRDHIVGLVDISAGGVALACSVGDAPPIKLMDEVVIVFESDRLFRPLSIRSQIRHIKVSDDDANIVYGVRFLDWNEERQRLAPKLRALFNEREAVRVDPREDHEIEVELVINGTARVASGLLRDISVLGVGVWVSTDDEPLLAAGNAIELTIRLPDGSEELRIDAEIRHMQPIGEQARLGVEIRNSGKGLSGTGRGITGYVMARQIEIARIDAERRRAMESFYQPN